MDTSLSDLTPWMQQKASELLDFASSQGINATVVGTRRSCAEQNQLYTEGRSAPGNVVTDAQGCQSFHVWGRAVDLQLDGPVSNYAILGDYWKSMGGIWGGDFTFKDLGHYEWHPDFELHDICPTGAECPDPNAPWPDDRPFFSKPAVLVTGGLLLTGLGVGIAYYLLKR